MPDRRRVAVVVTPLLALLAALLLNWSVAAAQAPDPLTLTLTAERSECTAGTLNPVTWEIEGGTPPYTLTLDGATVEVDAESATVTCGALPEGASTAPGTITAVVRDAAGRVTEASAAYTIVPPLPAPTGLSTGQVNSYHVGLNWDAVDGAGSQSPPVQNDRGRDEFDSYLFRYRDAEAEATAPYEFVGPLQYPFADVRPGPLDALLRPTTTGDYLGMVAAIRHPIEQETPAALNWSAAVPFGVVRAPENIAVQATHDTLEVSWDEQPYTQGAAVVRLVGGGIHQGRGPSGTTYADGRYHTRFRHLTPDSEYEITISIGADRAAIYSETTARTLPAPADWEPLPRGPQNLRVTTTHDSIIVRWDPPFPEAPYWFVSVSTIFNGTAWSVEQRTIGTPPPEGVTLRGDPPWLIRPNTTYSVLVAHDGFDGATAEVSVTTPAAPPALRLTLAAERAECTAGTLNPVTWEITGGAAPYRLTVDGASVDAGAEGAHATCGALPDYGIWLPVTAAPGTITAVVTDATGAPATASAAYTIVPPLPAPVATADVDVMRFSVLIQWRGLTVPASCDVPTGCFAFRTRRAGGTSWEYSWDEHRNAHRGWRPLVRRSVDAGGTTVEAGIASIRDPIEIETPDALRWSATVQATSLTDISGLTATATHDTVTVRWNRQPSADFWYVGIGGAEVGGGHSKFIMDWEDGWGEPTSATHEVTFTDLPPDTEYRVLVEGPEDLYAGPAAAVEATTTVRTAVAPADYTPPLRGPQNLRATATHDTITVRWDHPRTDTEDDYWLRISGPPGRVPIGARDEFVFPPDSAHTYGRLTPGTTYRIRVTHIDITRESAEITVTTKAAPPPLRLTLTAERSECTAGTLNPVTWTITGGTPPYTVTVDGETAAADATSAHATCGALPDYGIWLPVTQAPGTITAIVTDATGAPATASAAYTIVPPLPAPENVSARGLRTYAVADWDSVSAASGSVHYILRWKRTAASDWTYEHEFEFLEYEQGARRGWYSTRLPEGTAFEMAVAVMRNPIERQTPEALTWSARVSFATVTDPQNVVVTSTHDTITVTWDVGAGDQGVVWVSSAEGSKDPKTTTIADGQVRAEFTGLLPDTEYTISIRTLEVEDEFQAAGTSAQVRTKPAPPDWVPLPTGPKNLRVTATHDTITATWDPPHADADPSYRVLVTDVETGERAYYPVVITRTDYVLENLQASRSYEVQVTHYGATIAGETRTVVTRPAPTSALTCIEYLVGAVICT